MILFPAIDLVDKKAVRLYQGDYARMTVYSEDPLAVAQRMEAEGASAIHLVDLEGARDGGTPNLSVVARIAKETGLFTEVGGGVRDRDTIERYLASGVDRVILGTAAVRDPAFLRAAVARYGERIAVGVDLNGGKVAVSGWKDVTDRDAMDFCGEMQALGVSTLICTDISRDGAMKGANLALYRQLQDAFSVGIIASGGVSSLEDVRSLRDMGLYGAILGKAYYTGAVSLQRAIEVAR